MFIDCKGCIANNYHIADLKEQIQYLRNENARLTEHILDLESRSHSLIDHFTGNNRVINNEQKEFHSIPRKIGIQARIRNIEKQVNAESSIENARRKVEYDQRINKLLHPEIEVLDNGSDVSGYNDEGMERSS